MRLLVVAVSARMLAELAAADGHEVIACDRFGDVDLRAVCSRVHVAGGNDELVRAALRESADGVVYGAGLENRPDLVAALARRFELLGTPADALRAVRDPAALSALIRAAGRSAPALGDTALADPADGWLRKPLRGGGGRGVRRWGGGALSSGELLQRFVPGVPCSAVAVGNGAGAVVLGLTEQLVRGGGFAWEGNLAPPRLPCGELAALAEQLVAVCAAAGRAGVRGAFGVDAIWDGARAWVHELNPRPTASLELFGPRAFAAHLAGCRGAAPGPIAGSGPGVKLVMFADRPVRAPDPAWWPAGLVRDVPPAGTAIGPGEPVCTIVSGGLSLGEVVALRDRLREALPGAVNARG